MPYKLPPEPIRINKEMKTVREWCVSCMFDEVIIDGKKYFQIRKEKDIPKSKRRNFTEKQW